MHNIGTVVDIVTVKNNQLTVGGTTQARVFVKVKFDHDENIITYNMGDLQKYFD
tara:strand:- start:84 stop:245 length:162 start_codon:yes stop_codon:yes gene_type:complete